MRHAFRPEKVSKGPFSARIGWVFGPRLCSPAAMSDTPNVLRQWAAGVESRAGTALVAGPGDLQDVVTCSLVQAFLSSPPPFTIDSLPFSFWIAGPNYQVS